MPSPLATGNIPYSPITAKLGFVPFSAGSCPATLQEVGQWIAGFPVIFNTDKGFGYSAGTVADAGPETRTAPRLLFSSSGAYIGLGVWDPTLGAWVVGATIGELKTVVRSASTVEADMEAKGLLGAGWHLADGTNAAIPDLTANTGFFVGSGPNYTVYTVGYTGA